MDDTGKVLGGSLTGILIPAVLAVAMVLVAGAGITRGLHILETWRAGLAPAPTAAHPMPALAAIDVDQAVAPPPPAATPAATAAGHGPSRQTGVFHQTGACVLGGLAGTGAAMAAGPAELTGLVAGALLIPVSAPLIAAGLGGSFVAGCAATALVATVVR
jgi:hypothetical protein